MKNRLNLDWSINSPEERSDYVNKYISSLKFTPNEEELEKIACYILWGKNKEGKNAEQEGEIFLDRRNSTWGKAQAESLDALTESPTFQESTVHNMNHIPTRLPHNNFDRDETRKTAPPYILGIYEALWRNIDEVDYQINSYELIHGKRKEIRKSLTEKLSEDRRAQLDVKAKALTQFRYLKLRHLLVELRQEQYTLRDSYQTSICPRGNISEGSNVGTTFDEDVPVRPMGIIDNGLGFRDFGGIQPKSYTEKEIGVLTHRYWERRNTRPGQFVFDFEDLESVYSLLMARDDLLGQEEDFEGTTTKLWKTLRFYIEQAHLTDIQEEILEMKISKAKNQDIALHINKKYGKSYTVNYISTLFRQKIIPEINSAAHYHGELIRNLPFEEEFKVCTKCGRILLRSSENFVKKNKSKDGFSNHCKRCDKEERDFKKIGKY